MPFFCLDTLGVSVVIILKSMFIILHLANFVTISLSFWTSVSVYVKAIEKNSFKLCASLKNFFFMFSPLEYQHKRSASHSQSSVSAIWKLFFLIYIFLLLCTAYSHHHLSLNFKCRFSLMFARSKKNGCKRLLYLGRTIYRKNIHKWNFFLFCVFLSYNFSFVYTLLAF